MMKRILCILLLCMLSAACALAEPIQLESPEQAPETTEAGFLPDGSEPVYYKNHAEGYWLYISATERIEIKRYTETKPALMYYIADIQFAPGTTFTIKSVSEDRPGKREAAPANLAATVRAAYTQNTDYYTYRVTNGQYPGNIVRQGKVLYSKSLSKLFIRLPNLATMGLYPDGHAEVNEAYEKSAEEYVADGATDVIAFGPILIRDGEIQDVAQGTYHNKEPRSCIGWIDNQHYIGLLVEGRRDHSKGASMQMCAEIMQAQGCVGAINLDGGGSAAMLFMGESVQMTDRGKVADTIRWMPDLLCAGFY